jgi:hypothetical protein
MILKDQVSLVQRLSDELGSWQPYRKGTLSAPLRANTALLRYRDRLVINVCEYF